MTLGYDPGRIIECESGADALQWEAAGRIHAGAEAGKTHRQIGAEIGKSHTHVRLAVVAWREFGNLGFQDRPPFNEAYQAAKESPPKRRPPTETKQEPVVTGDDGSTYGVGESIPLGNHAPPKLGTVRGSIDDAVCDTPQIRPQIGAELMRLETEVCALASNGLTPDEKDTMIRALRRVVEHLEGTG